MTKLYNNAVYNFCNIQSVVVYHIKVDIRDKSTYLDFKAVYVLKY